MARQGLRLAPDEARLALMLKALGNPIRFQIVKHLAECKTCITQDIVEATPLAQATVSQHLKVLREAGLIHGEIEGPATCYCIDPQGVTWLKEQIGAWLPECCPPGNPSLIILDLLLQINYRVIRIQNQIHLPMKVSKYDYNI